MTDDELIDKLRTALDAAESRGRQRVVDLVLGILDQPDDQPRPLIPADPPARTDEPPVRQLPQRTEPARPAAAAHGTVNYADVATIANDARSRGESMQGAVAQAFGISLDAAAQRIAKARRLGHDIPRLRAPVECDRCGRTFPAMGIGPHRRKCRGGVVAGGGVRPLPASAGAEPDPPETVIPLPSVPSGLGPIEPVPFDPDAARIRAAEQFR